MTYELVHRPREEEEDEGNDGGVFLLRRVGADVKGETVESVVDPAARKKDRNQVRNCTSSSSCWIPFPFLVDGRSSSCFGLSLSLYQYVDFEEDYDRKAFEYGDLGFPDDGYDYSQHMKVIGDGGVFVPALGVKAVTYEESLELGEAAKRRELEEERRKNEDLDEVMALLESDNEDEVVEDEDDDEEEITTEAESDNGFLPDDFISKATAGPNHGTTSTVDGQSIEDDAEEPFNLSPEQARKPRLVDEQFDRFFEDYEDDSEEEDGDDSGDSDEDDDNDKGEHGDGDLKEEEEEEVANDVRKANERVLAEALEEFIHDMASVQLVGKDGVGRDDARVLEFAEQVEEETEADLEVVEVEDETAERWDCETVISTYSNLDNHPRVIGLPPLRRRPIRLDPKLQAPADYLPPHIPKTRVGNDRAEDEDQDDEAKSVATTTTPVVGTVVRPRGESAEERRIRKEAARALKRERRVEKKEMREAFRTENTRQGRCAAAMGTAKVSVQFP